MHHVFAVRSAFLAGEFTFWAICSSFGDSMKIPAAGAALCWHADFQASISLANGENIELMKVAVWKRKECGILIQTKHFSS